MAQVLGIGGIFFKADDKVAVEDWYRRVLGFDIQKWGGAMFKPTNRAYQVWTPFAGDTKHFEPSTHPFMVNLMVDDLDGVLEKAKAAGVEPLGREDGDYGKFAWILDPAGVKLELWEPVEETAS
jgi:catechol 2,3-dioxygenase-like lactoylglutathione lyase family enzyme